MKLAIECSRLEKSCLKNFLLKKFVGLVYIFLNLCTMQMWTAKDINKYILSEIVHFFHITISYVIF